MVVDGGTQITLTVGSICTVLAAGIVGAYRLATFLLRLRDNFKTLWERHEIMWQALLNRGRVEGEASGHLIFGGKAITSDAFRISVDAQERFAPIKYHLLRFVSNNPKITDKELSLAIEKDHGEWILEHVCRPLAVHQMSCLVMAVAIARSLA